MLSQYLFLIFLKLESYGPDLYYIKSDIGKLVNTWEFPILDLYFSNNGLAAPTHGWVFSTLVVLSVCPHFFNVIVDLKTW